MTLYFYYQPSYGCKAHKVLKTSHHVNPDIIETLRHDFCASIRPISPLRREVGGIKVRVERETAQRAHNSLKKGNEPLYREFRNSLIKAIIESPTPRWGSFKLTVG